MADNSKIEWTNASWQVTHGCTILTPGCTHCYAMRQAQRLALMGQPQYAGLTQQTKNGPVWNGTVRPCSDEHLMAPLRWRKPRMIFVNSMSDLFHEDVPEEHIDRVIAVAALADQHTLQFLSKRSARMRAYFAGLKPGVMGEGALPDRIYEQCQHILDERRAEDIRYMSWNLPAWPLPNAWVGVSVEDQQRADERIPDLLDTPAAVRFISAEPLLGRLDLESHPHHHYLYPFTRIGPTRPALDWVICGGESGPHRRPVDPDWLRSLRDQCAAAGVPFFAKQIDKVRELPPDLRQLEFPRPAASLLASAAD